MHESEYKTVVLICSNIEWKVISRIFPDKKRHSSPHGQWFSADLKNHEKEMPVVFFHGGWGKISAASSTQFIIDKWAPGLLINIGTCGGFEGEIERGTIILVERTIVYDIIEQMEDSEEAIAHYSTDIDLSWLEDSYPQDVLRTLIVSGDRDLLVEDIPTLKAEYGAVAGDWESGAIAWVANRNNTRCLILRGVTDLVGGTTGEAYDGNIHIFEKNADIIIVRLVEQLPQWIAKLANDKLKN